MTLYVAPVECDAISLRLARLVSINNTNNACSVHMLAWFTHNNVSQLTAFNANTDTI